MPDTRTFIGADGKEYEVRPLSINGLMAIEKKFNLESIEDAFDMANLGFSRLENVRWLLWLVLNEVHEDLQEETVGKIINLQNLPDARDAILWAFTISLPEAGDDETPEDDSNDEVTDPLA